jgi:hypothetical protein
MGRLLDLFDQAVAAINAERANSSDDERNETNELTPLNARVFSSPSTITCDSSFPSFLSSPLHSDTQLAGNPAPETIPMVEEAVRNDPDPAPETANYRGYEKNETNDISHAVVDVGASWRNLAWGELQNRWHMAHGKRVPRHLCAGCRKPISNAAALDLIDGCRVHDTAGHHCLIRWGACWRSAATRALAAMGLTPKGTRNGRPHCR